MNLFDLFSNYGIDLIAAVILLITGVIGLVGKTLPFRGKEKFTAESESKTAHIMAVPCILAALFTIYSIYRNYIDNTLSDNNTLISIVILLAVLIVYAVIWKMVRKEK